MPSHVELHGFYADTYRTDLNNVLNITPVDRFARVYPSLTPAELAALKPYMNGLSPEVRALHAVTLMPGP